MFLHTTDKGVLVLCVHETVKIKAWNNWKDHAVLVHIISFRPQFIFNYLYFTYIFQHKLQISNCHTILWSECHTESLSYTILFGSLSLTFKCHLIHFSIWTEHIFILADQCDTEYLSRFTVSVHMEHKTGYWFQITFFI